MTAWIVMSVTGALLLGCGRKAPDMGTSLAPTSGSKHAKSLVPPDESMGAASAESTADVIPPSATVASESDGAAPTLGIEERMEERIAPALRALKEAALRGDGPAGATAAEELRRELEPTPYSPDAPREEANFDAFNGLTEDAVQCAAEAERAAKENDREGLAAAVTEVEAACKACHQVFRAKH